MMADYVEMCARGYGLKDCYGKPVPRCGEECASCWREAYWRGMGEAFARYRRKARAA